MQNVIHRMTCDICGTFEDLNVTEVRPERRPKVIADRLNRSGWRTGGTMETGLIDVCRKCAKEAGRKSAKEA